MSSKDKEKVIGEVLDEAQITRFLAMQPTADESADFQALLKAYRGLPATAFERFVELFKAEGRDINAPDSKGRSLLQQIQDNIRHAEYTDILKKFGAL